MELVTSWLAASPGTGTESGDGPAPGFGFGVAVAAASRVPKLSHPPSEYPTAASADAESGHDEGAPPDDAPPGVDTDPERTPNTSVDGSSPTSKPNVRRAPKTTASVAFPASSVVVWLVSRSPIASIDLMMTSRVASLTAAVSVAVTIAETHATSSPACAASAAASTSARSPLSAEKVILVASPAGADRRALGGADETPASSVSGASRISVRKSAVACSACGKETQA